jgi:hypothetical protein
MIIVSISLLDCNYDNLLFGAVSDTAYTGKVVYRLHSLNDGFGATEFSALAYRCYDFEHWYNLGWFTAILNIIAEATVVRSQRSRSWTEEAQSTNE